MGWGPGEIKGTLNYPFLTPPGPRLFFISNYRAILRNWFAGFLSLEKQTSHPFLVKPRNLPHFTLRFALTPPPRYLIFITTVLYYDLVNRVCTRVMSSYSQIQNLRGLSSLGIRGTRFISVYNCPAQRSPSFGNQRILNFEVTAVRDIKQREKIYTYLSRFLAILVV